MIVNPGIRRFLGSAIQRLFNSASFYAPLTHSAIPERAAPGTTATFTRATTKTVENNDGYLVTLLAGEIGFPGARRVANKIAGSSEDFSNAAWTAKSIGGAAAPTVTANQAIAPDGTMTASLITGGTSYPAVEATSTVAYTAGVWILSLYVKKGVGEIVLGFSVDGGDEAPFDTATGLAGSVGANISDAGSTDEGDYWRFYAVSTRTAVAKKPIIYNGFPTASSFYIWGAQLEDVTAQTTQTAGEYVSVGVPSDWAGDELVTNGTFDTDTTWIKESGWTIGGGAAIAATASATLYQTDTLAIGTKYVASFSVSSVSAGSVSIRIGAAPLVPYDFKTAAGTYSVEFVADAVSTLVGVIGVGFTGTVDNINVKPAYYHGSFVDGVKCFPTDINGAAIPSTTLLGYQAEGARTNLCLQSQTFDNASWVKMAGGGASVPVVTANQTIAPDGTLTADKVVFVAPVSGDISSLYQAPVLAAGTYTGAIYVKAFAAGDIGKKLGFRHAAGAAYSLITLTADWQRFSSTEVRAANNFDITLRPSEGTSSGTVSCYIWGAQLELGSFASSYIATTTAAVTRNADVLTYSSAGNVSGTVGWCYAEVTPAAISTSNQVILGTNGANRTPAYQLATSGSFGAYDGTNAPTFAVSPFTANVEAKVASSWGTAGLQGGVNGAVSALSTFDGNYDFTDISVGVNNSSTNSYFGNIGPIYIGQRQLSASELQAITS